MTCGWEILGWATTTVAVAGVVANNHRLRWCFWLWMASNSASAAIHLAAGMWPLVVRDAVFFALAIHGLAAWSKAKSPSGKSASMREIALAPSIGAEVGATRQLQNGPVQ